MNFYTESFDQFASKLTALDIALYAGLGLVLWVLFKDRLSPVQEMLRSLISKVNNNPSTNLPPVVSMVTSTIKKEDVFFKLVESWKRTRDLAVQSECEEAVKVADQMFPYLSPSICSGIKSKDIIK